MSTRNIVPRNDGEGNLGTVTKKWNGVYTNNLNGRSVDADTKTLDATKSGLDTINTSVSDIKTELITINSALASNTQSINSLKSAVGSPLVAESAAKMQDTSKIYVYTGAESGYTKGNWYYYNGTAWTSGGVYNSVAVQTDKTLSVSDVPADAETTGSKVSTGYTFSKEYTDTTAKNYVLDIPDEVDPIKTDTSDSKYLFDSEDAIVFNFKKPDNK